MRDQIKKILSLSQKLTVSQIAQQLHVSKNLVMKTLKDDNSCLCYQFHVEYLGQKHDNNDVPMEGWFRKIQIEGNMTLNGLNDCIQHVLGWDNTHCCIFTAREKHYAYFGEDDDFVVEDYFENHYSTKIPLYSLGLCENDYLVYCSDLGDKHIFLLTVSGIECGNESALPMVIGARGKELVQYEPWDYDEDAPSSSAENAELDVDEINATLSKALANRQYYDRTVDFIVAKDRDTLEKWRRSKDKRKWEMAVTILENRSMSIGVISKKIERPIKKVRKWIRIFNYYGMEGLQQTIAKRSYINIIRQEKIEQRKKRLIEIIHHKPKFYNVNRSNWSIDSLVKVHHEQFNEIISNTTVQTYLKECKYTIKKARRVLTSPDPEYREKVDILLKTLNALGPDDLLFLSMSLDLSRYGNMGAGHIQRLTRHRHTLRISLEKVIFRWPEL